MYISRSDAHRAQKSRRRRKIRTLLMVNLTMLLIIAGLALVYVFKFQGNPLEADAGNDRSWAQEQGQVTTGQTEEGVEPESVDEVESTDPASETAEPGDSPESQIGNDGVEQAGGDPVTEPVEEVKAQIVMPDKDGITMSFVGDIQMSGKVAELINKNGDEYPFHYVKSMFEQDDLTVANLETPITTGGIPAEDKQFVFKSAPSSAGALGKAGIDMVTLANNHVLDHGVPGLMDTIKHLDAAGIQHFGAGKDEEDAFKISYVERKGKRIALLGFSRVLPKASWFAKGKNPGVAESYNSAKAREKIAEARKEADFVIVTVHWGAERADKPNAVQKQLAREYVDAGADLIVGSHPHVLQGFEQYKGKWIAYSLGNFVFTRSSTPMTWETAVLQVTLNHDGSCALQMFPYHANLGQAVPMDKTTGSKLLKRISTLSHPFGAEVRQDGRIGTISRMR